MKVIIRKNSRGAETWHTPFIRKNPDLIEMDYLHSRGEFSVDADLAHEAKCRKILKDTAVFGKKICPA